MAKKKTGTKPSPNGDNGRDTRGRFAKGNPGGPGNPLAKRVGELRAELLRTITPATIRAVVAKLIAKAKTGDAFAAREVLNRAVGLPLQADILERLHELETTVEELKHDSPDA